MVLTMILGVTVNAAENNDSLEWIKVDGFSRLDENARSSIYTIAGNVLFDISYDGVAIANVSAYMEFEINDGNSAKVTYYEEAPSFDDISGDSFTVSFSHSNAYNDGSGAYVEYYFTVRKFLLAYTYRETIYCDIYGEVYRYGGLVK